MLKFSWDPTKARKNLKKHRVSFEEASTVFNDEFAKIFFDEIHSDDDIREIIIGHSLKGKLLIVCFAEIAEGLVRIITARRPTRSERQDYEG